MEGFDEEDFRAATSVITCDLNGTVKTFTHGAEKVFGYAPDEVVNKESVAIFHRPENVAELVPRLLKTAVETGKFEEEVELVRKDGTVFRANLAVRPMYREGKLVGYMGMTRPL